MFEQHLDVKGAIVSAEPVFSVLGLSASRCAYCMQSLAMRQDRALIAFIRLHCIRAAIGKLRGFLRNFPITVPFALYEHSAARLNTCLSSASNVFAERAGNDVQ